MIRRSSRSCGLAALLLAASPVTSGQVWPGESWEQTTPAAANMNPADLDAARNASDRGGTSSGFIVRGGRLVYSWGDLAAVPEVKSITKAIGSAALGIALEQQRLSLADRATTYLPDLGDPQNNPPEWLNAITIEQLATQSAGFEKSDSRATPPCDAIAEPGTQWAYSDCGVNWLADVLTTRFNQDLYALLNDAIFTRIGIGPQALTWREHNYRGRTLNGVTRRELASGISASADALARIGLLYLRNGAWQGQQLVPASFIDQARRPSRSILNLPLDLPDLYPRANEHYGMLWWTNGAGAMAGLPNDAFWGWGLADQLLVVVPSLDLVIVRQGPALRQGCNNTFCTDYAILSPVLGRIASAVTDTPVVTLGVNPTSVVAGGPTSLRWAARNADSCSASGGGWETAGARSPTGEETSRALNADTTFVLECSGGGRTVRQEVFVKVQAAAPPPPEPTVDLTASAASVQSGSDVTLSWTARHATTCTASGGVGGWPGTKGVSDSQTVGPLTQDTTFTLRCEGAGGSAEDSVTVTIAAAPPPAPTVTLTANPTTVTAGGTTTLTWETTNATACTASGAWQGAKAAGGGSETSPTLSSAGTSTFTLQCTGPGGESAPASASVTVNAAAATPPPSSGGGGGGGALEWWSLLGLLLASSGAARRLRSRSC